MAKLPIYFLSALLIISSAIAAHYDSIYPFKLGKTGVQTCYWVAQDPATRCLLTSKKTVPPNKQKVDVHVYTHCRETCESHLPAGVTQEKDATDSEMKFPFLRTGFNYNSYVFKTCNFIKNSLGVSNGYLLFLISAYFTYLAHFNCVLF